MRHNRQGREEQNGRRGLSRMGRDSERGFSRRQQVRPDRWEGREEDEDERSYREEGRRTSRDMRGQGYRHDNYELLDEDRWGPSYGRPMEDFSENRGRYAGHGPKSYRRSDERIKEDVCEALTHDSNVDASDIEVEVKEGEVTLSGHVPERRMKHMAEDVVEHCNGVKDVTNNLRVRRESSSSSSSESEDRSDRKNASSSSSSAGNKKTSASTAASGSSH